MLSSKEKKLPTTIHDIDKKGTIAKRERSNFKKEGYKIVYKINYVLDDQSCYLGNREDLPSLTIFVGREKEISKVCKEYLATIK